VITKLFNNPRILSQTADDDDSIEEPAIALHTDAGGLIILNQGGNEILVNKNSVNELCKVLKELRDATKE
jgi:hypothetical protein